MKFVFMLMCLLFSVTAQAQIFDGGKITSQEQAWFNDPLVQGCCNLGDAFKSDFIMDKKGQLYAEITDGIDHLYNIQAIPPGTLIPIPKAIQDKMKDPHYPKNPTGHGVVFLRVMLYNQMIIGQKTDDNDRMVRHFVKPENADVLCWWPPALG